MSFIHPGVLSTREELEFVKAKVLAGAEPWKSGYSIMLSYAGSSLSYTAHPVSIVDVGPYEKPNVGGRDEYNDAMAAYSHALQWYIEGDTAHAQKAMEILNAWSAVLHNHGLSNAPLQAAWCGSVFPRAAEILRYSYSGWTSTDTDNFNAMMYQAFVPLIQNGSRSNGNWELSQIESMMAIAIFKEDSSLFERAVNMWKKRVPAYLYLASDGPLPVRPDPIGLNWTDTQLLSYWYNPGQLVDGLCQETCRDFLHTQMGLGAMINAAESALHQGVDLYSGETVRITTAMEWHAQYLTGTTPPFWLKTATSNIYETWEIAYNHYHNRKGISMPHTQKAVTMNRPTGYFRGFLAWETLTHAEIGEPGAKSDVMRQSIKRKTKDQQ